MGIWPLGGPLHPKAWSCEARVFVPSFASANRTIVRYDGCNMAVDNPPATRGQAPRNRGQTGAERGQKPRQRGLPKPPHLAVGLQNQPLHLVVLVLTATAHRRKVGGSPDQPRRPPRPSSRPHPSAEGTAPRLSGHMRQDLVAATHIGSRHEWADPRGGTKADGTSSE